MIHERQRRKSPHKQVVFRLYYSDAIAHSVAAIVEAFRRKIVFASPVDKFIGSDHEVTWVKETIDLDELLVTGHLWWFNQVRHEQFIFEFLGKEHLSWLITTYSKVSTFSCIFLSSISKKSAIYFCFYRFLFSYPLSASFTIFSKLALSNRSY